MNRQLVCNGLCMIEFMLYPPRSLATNPKDPYSVFVSGVCLFDQLYLSHVVICCNLVALSLIPGRVLTGWPVCGTLAVASV